MTQYQQVLEALRALGGKAQFKDICSKIDSSSWKTKTPEQSVASYLSTGSDFEKDNDLWILKPVKKNTDNEEDNICNNNQNGVQENHERGIYFITLNPEIRLPTAGFLFKIGTSEKASNRLKQYSASLPFDVIRCIAFYPIPEKIDLKEIETQIRGEILGGGSIDFKVRRFIGGNQIEWLQTLELDFNIETINKVAKSINKIIDDTIQYILSK
jgi:hypothetical protein